MPGYHAFIKEPMDFSTMEKKLSDGAYTDIEGFRVSIFLQIDSHGAGSRLSLSRTTFFSSHGMHRRSILRKGRAPSFTMRQSESRPGGRKPLSEKALQSSWRKQNQPRTDP